MSDGFLILAIGFAVLAYGLQKVLYNIRPRSQRVEQIFNYTLHVAVIASALSWIASFAIAAWGHF